MNNKKIALAVLLLTAVALIGIPNALAFGSFLNAFNAKYGTEGTALDTCDTCHVPGQPFSVRNPYGLDIESALAGGASVDEALSGVEQLDSDNDSFSNIEEINALTFPGDPDSHPALPQCSDGIDNDGDGLIDFPVDPGCESPEDNDETDVVPPVAANVSGGGWIVSPTTQGLKKNNKATFGFYAEFNDSMPWGNLSYKDHVSNMKVNGNVTMLIVDKMTMTATFKGIAKVNGMDGYDYEVTVVDNGEPGNMDTFTINIPSLPYMASGTLMGGNIKIQEP